MFKAKATFSGFSVDDLATAKEFYAETLGLKVDDEGKGILRGISKNQGLDIAWFKDPAGNILAVLEVA